MLSRQAVARLCRAARPITLPQQAARASFSTTRTIRAGGTPEMSAPEITNPAVDDPGMNGGYINPPAIKRQFRDPYADWTDKQERRNFGEPVHEDEDILGIFSLEEYTHMTPTQALALWSAFLICVGGLSYAVYLTYPDRPSAPKIYEGGLDRELGGAGSARAYKAGDEFQGSTL